MSKPEIRIDLSPLRKRFSEGALKSAQEAFARRVAFEMRDYVPLDEGTLRDSEPLSSNYAGGVIEWDTPYADRVYNLPSVRTVKNPNARPKWAEAAKRERIGSWEAFARNLMEGGGHGRS